MAAKKKNRALKILVTVFAVLVIGGGAGICALTLNTADTSADTSEEKSPAYVNPLTGEGTDQELPARPLQVSIDNVGDAVPQSWLSKADMVYEFPVEGRQTRLQALYYGEFPEEFGPIRSTRPYFVDMAREYEAVFLAHGWSEEAKNYLFSGVVPYINAMNSALPFYRSTEKAAPHNSYIKWEDVKGHIEERGWWKEKQEIRPFQFMDKLEVPDGEYAYKISFNYAASDCEFTYDPAKSTYVRTINGAKYIDLETGESIETDNIIVQKVSSTIQDEKGRLKINMCAGGDAILFTDGKAIKGTWSRKSLDSRTIFVDEDGNEFRLSQGTTWVEVTDQSCSIKTEKPDNLEAVMMIDAVKGTPAVIKAAMAEEE